MAWEDQVGALHDLLFLNLNGEMNTPHFSRVLSQSSSVSFMRRMSMGLLSQIMMMTSSFELMDSMLMMVSSMRYWALRAFS